MASGASPGLRTKLIDVVWSCLFSSVVLRSKGFAVCFSNRGTIKLKTADDVQKAVEHLHKKELAGRPLHLAVYSK